MTGPARSYRWLAGPLPADVEASLRFWRDGLGFAVVMDGRFDGDWPALLRAPSTSLRAVFLGGDHTPGGGGS